MDKKVTYVPILKSKQGEFNALRNLNLEVTKTMCPFFEIGKPETKVQKEKGLEQFLTDTITNISACWKKPNNCFLDIYNHDLNARTSNGEHLLNHIFKTAQMQNLAAIPVIGLERDAEYELATKQLKELGFNEVAFRLLAEDIETGASEVSIDVLAMMDRLDIMPRSAHLLIDLRFLSNSTPLSETENRILEFIREFEELSDFNSVILASTAFPPSMGVVKSKSVTSLPRLEYKLWLQVQKNLGDNLKLLFGDYGINHPDMLELDWSKGISPAAKIRYTTEEEWIIFKGSSLKKSKKYAQYFDLAANVTNNDCYLGNKFSWGDDQISEKAQKHKGTGPGNTTTWVGIDTNHHLTFVSKQLANSL